VGIYILMIILGWGNIYAAVYNEDHPSILDFSQKYGKQMMFVGGAFLIAIIILIIDESFYTTFAWGIYGIAILTLISVLFLGTEISGSKSWFRFGSFGVQPAEFAKFATCLALSKFISNTNIKLRDQRTKVIAAAIILIPAVIIVAQKETGGALVLLSFVFVLFREGLPVYYLLFAISLLCTFFISLVYDSTVLLIVAISIAVLVFFISKKSGKNLLYIILGLSLAIGIIFGAKEGFEHFPKHQKKRVNVFLGIETDKKDKAWNETQSLIAIGSGGFWGKGYLQGTQTKYDFVPEQETDFIFCTVGEEWGFVGSLFVIVLFATLIIRLVLMAERQRSPFSRIYGYGVASVFLFHMMVNIGMTIGLVPVIGIPLPFFSYGGSSLWAFTILLFIFLKLDSRRLQILA